MLSKPKGQFAIREISATELEKIANKCVTSGGEIAGWIALGAVASVGILFLIGLALAH